MQFKKRFTLISVFVVLTVIAFFDFRHAFSPRQSKTVDAHRRSLFSDFRTSSGHSHGNNNPRSFLVDDTYSVFENDVHHNPKNRTEFQARHDWRQCRMETCFDFTKCRDGFKIYIYPRQAPVSAPYAKILSVIERSRYTTANPQEACIFVPSIDTLDQDVLSKDYVPEVGEKLESLPYWNGGRNHLLFNQYAGTRPTYLEELPFIQQAMLVKSSMSVNWIRYGFDVSLPLSPKDHPQSVGDMGSLHLISNPISSTRHYLLAFKGKRYPYGIGSDTRNALHHIHNGKDVVLLTTCKHGRDWEKWMDERCPRDMQEYEK